MTLDDDADSSNGSIQTIEDENDETKLDVLPWKSSQRVVITMTNPVESHQVTVLNITASLVDQNGKSVELPPVRFNEIILKDHQTFSLAYEFKI